MAPYEADTQLAWLAKGEGVGGAGVSAVVSEDSDLMAYGCPKVTIWREKGGRGA